MTGQKKSPNANKSLIRRYYEDLWNNWNLDVVDEIISDNITFRGSLSVTLQGRDEFKQYVALVRAAFPDFHNAIEDLIAEGDKVVARLTYRGTHQGALFGIAPTGKPVTYVGIALFRIADGKIVDGWVIGDTMNLMRQLGAMPATEWHLQEDPNRPAKIPFSRATFRRQMSSND
jgi:steroid delta-isomerase-like uncharacterized protein